MVLHLTITLCQSIFFMPDMSARTNRLFFTIGGPDGVGHYSK